MHRFIGTFLAVVLVIAVVGSGAALAYDSPRKYGVEFRGGFNIYDMGDVPSSTLALQQNLNRASVKNSIAQDSSGLSGGLSFLYRPTAHTMWEAGYNAILDVENTVDTTPDTASGQILMHANEFFVKGNVIATITRNLEANFGAGVSYYNVELQIQDNLSRRYNYDAVGRSWGLIGTVGLEYFLTQRAALSLQGGGRITNAGNFSYESSSGSRTGVPVINGSRSMEVNLAGVFASLGLRIYFDKVTKPIDFTR